MYKKTNDFRGHGCSAILSSSDEGTDGDVILAQKIFNKAMKQLDLKLSGRQRVKLLILLQEWKQQAHSWVRAKGLKELRKNITIVAVEPC